MFSDVERAAALRAIRSAATLADSLQCRLGDIRTLTKDDHSPVTVADFAVQAVIYAALRDELGDVALVAEESAADLRGPSRTSLLEAVTAVVADVRSAGSTSTSVLEWLEAGAGDGTSERFWTLDPIDGTRGFLRGDQYAIALALIDRGEVILGVLACPNLENADGTRGAILLANGHDCVAYNGNPDIEHAVRVASPARLADARVCESVESGHSDHGMSAEVAARLGIRTDPLRIDSQCKYAAIARGDASIYLRLPTSATYREKIWDHAAGKLIVESAGGRVTDVEGTPLDFGHGRQLVENRGVIATDGRFHDEIVEAVLAVMTSAPTESSRSR